MRGRRDRLRSSLSVDRLGVQTPTDLARRERLESLGIEAAVLGLDAERSAIELQRNRLVTRDAKLWTVEPDPERTDLSTAIGSGRLLVGYKNRLEVWDGRDSRVLRTFDLRALTAGLPADLSQYWAEALRPSRRSALRAPASLLQLNLDPTRPRTVRVDVGYDNFGLEDLSRATIRRSYVVEGENFYSDDSRERAEQERLLLNLEDFSLQSAGLLRAIRWADASNLVQESGPSWVEARDVALPDHPAWIENAVSSYEGKTSAPDRRTCGIRTARTTGRSRETHARGAARTGTD